MNGDDAQPDQGGEQPQEPMVPMFSPDGILGDVPQSQVPAAVKGGGKIGQEMLSPTGERGVVPLEHVHDAVKAGGQLAGGAPQQPTQPQEIPETAWEKIKSTIAGLFTAPPSTGPRKPAGPGEQAATDAHNQQMSDQYGNAFGMTAGGGLTKLGEEGAVIASPVLARVAKEFFKDSDTYKAFVNALHGESEAEGAVESMAHQAPAEATPEADAAAEATPDLPKVKAKTVKQSQALAPDAVPQQQAEALKTAPTPPAEPDPSLDQVPPDELEAGQNLETEVEGTPKPKSQTGDAPQDVKAKGKQAAESAFLKKLGVTKEDIATANTKGKLAYQKHLTQQAVKGAKFGERGGATPELMQSAKTAARSAYLKHLGITEAELEEAKGAARQGFMDHYNKSMNKLTKDLKAAQK